MDTAVRVARRASFRTLSEHEESEFIVNPRGLYAGLNAASDSFSFWYFCAAVATSRKRGKLVFRVTRSFCFRHLFG